MAAASSKTGEIQLSHFESSYKNPHVHILFSLICFANFHPSFLHGTRTNEDAVRTGSAALSSFACVANVCRRSGLQTQAMCAPRIILFFFFPQMLINQAIVYHPEQKVGVPLIPQKQKGLFGLTRAVGAVLFHWFGVVCAMASGSNHQRESVGRKTIRPCQISSQF